MTIDNQSNASPEQNVSPQPAQPENIDSASNYYTERNMDYFWEQLNLNISGKDKLVIALNSLFLSGISLIFNLREFDLWGTILIGFLSLFFIISLGCSLWSFYLAERISYKKYKIICDGINNKKVLTDKKLEKKFKKIDVKYNSNKYDFASILFCFLGLIMFPIAISVAIKLFMIKPDLHSGSKELGESHYYYIQSNGEFMSQNKDTTKSVNIEKGYPHRMPIKQPSSPVPPKTPPPPDKKNTDGKC